MLYSHINTHCANRIAFSAAIKVAARASALFQVISKTALKALDCILCALSLHFRARTIEGACVKFRQLSLYSWSDYEEKVLKLRQTLAKADQENGASCERVFTNPELLEQVLLNGLRGGCLESSSKSALYGDLNKLEQAYERLYQECNDRAWAHKRAFDPLLFGNLPFAWTQLTHEGRQSKLIRMPAPIIDQGNETIIAPEFCAYMRHLKDQRQRHLYANLMDRHNGNEKRRSQTLLEWSRTTPALDYASLDKNSSFYINRMGNMSFQQLRQDTKNWLLSHEHHIWPLEQGQLVELVDRALTNIDQAFEQVFFDATSQKRYLDLAHTECLRLLYIQLQPHSINISCKNCIDRGASQQVLLAAWNEYSQGRPFWSEEKGALILTSAYLVSGRAMQKNRFDRCIEALRYIEKLQSKQERVE